MNRPSLKYSAHKFKLSPFSTRAGWISCGLAVLILFQFGCGSNRRSGGQGRSNSVQREIEKQVNFIESAFAYTLDTQRFEDVGFRSSMIENLNGWIRGLETSDNWKPDPMIESIPDEFQSLESVQNIGQLRFQSGDPDFLQEAIWLKAVADRVASRHSNGTFQYLISAASSGMENPDIQKMLSSEDRLSGAVSALHPELSVDETEHLTRALRLFDWTVRNIQLDEMPVRFSPEEVMLRGTKMVDNPTGDAPRDGVEGPGYTETTGQVLTFGKGDLWQKSRVFLLLCRQLGIEVFYLNVTDRNNPDLTVPWAMGVMAGDQIFLFDMKMGLPIPGKEYRRIATLKEVTADPTVLTQLRFKVDESTDADPDYRIQPKQLESLVAWLDASEESLSRRMELLQTRLKGDYLVNVSYSPAAIADRLKECGLEKIQLSPIPFETRQYRNTFAEAIRRKKEAALLKNYLDEQYFSIKIPIKRVVRKDRIDENQQSLKSGQRETIEIETYLLTEARHRYLLGVFGADVAKGRNTLGSRKLKDDLDAGRKTLDAAQMFMDLTLDDERIDEILSDKDWAFIMGLDVESNVNAQDQQKYFVIFEAAMRLIRTDSSIWLGLSNFETENYGNARNWFQQISRFDNTDKWRSLAEYNLARTHEALSDFGEAIKLYRKSSSTQKFGNIIRARLIQRWNLGDKTAAKPE